MADLLRYFRRGQHATIPVTVTREMIEQEIAAAQSMMTPRRREAEDKAERLLRSKLTPHQKSTFGHGYFDVEGSRGGHYRIHTYSTVQNITGTGRFQHAGFCVGLGYGVPRCDVWLFQKILIESDEGLFLRAAVNWFPVRDPHDIDW